MNLIPEWRLMHKLWSFRLAILSAVLSAGEVAVQMLDTVFPSGMFALAAGVISLCAGLARIVAQPKAYRND